MNTHIVSTEVAPPTALPVVRIQSLAHRALAAFPECRISWGLVADWCKEHLLLQHRWSRDAAAIDDEMERVAPDLAECLRQVPPDVRRRILRAVNETHRRSETRAAELEK